MFKKKNYLRIALVSLSLLLIAVLFAGCSSGNPPAPTAQAPSLLDRVNALETQTKNTDSNVSKLTPRVEILEGAVKNVPNNSDVQKALQQSQQNTTDINSLKSQSTNNPQLVNDVSSIKTQNTQNATDIKTLQQQVKDLTEQNKTLTAQVKTLNDNASQSSGSSSSSSSSSSSTSSSDMNSSTYNGVKATIVSSLLSWNGTPLLSTQVPQMAGGNVTQVNLINHGSGYTTPPTISFASPPGGRAATAVSSIDSNGVVTSITITDGGTGYTTTNGILFISAPPANGVQATATASINTISNGTSSTTFQINLQNKNTFVVNNLQMALGLVYVDNNGNPVNIPTWLSPTAGTMNANTVNIGVSSNSFGLGWAYQNVVSPSTFVFSNSNTSSIFNSGLSLNGNQSTNITIWVTITNNSPTIMGNPINLYPVIKVLGYTQ